MYRFVSSNFKATKATSDYKLAHTFSRKFNAICHLKKRQQENKQAYNITFHNSYITVSCKLRQLALAGYSNSPTLSQSE